jgi:hypothetical protein
MVTSCDGAHPVATSTYDWYVFQITLAFITANSQSDDGTFCRTMLVYDKFPVTSANPTTAIICAEPAYSIGVLYRTVVTPVLATGTFVH